MGPVLAIDPGRRYVGLAVSNPESTIAFPLEVIPAEPYRALVQKLKEIVLERSVEQVIMGRPVALRGTSLPMTAWTEKLATKIQKALDLPVTLVDERLSTKAAEMATNHGRVDAHAAALFLQTFLERASIKDRPHG